MLKEVLGNALRLIDRESHEPRLFGPGRPSQGDPPREPGLYRLIRKDTGEVIYIGQASNLAKRIWEHWKEFPGIRSIVAWKAITPCFTPEAEPRSRRCPALSPVCELCDVACGGLGEVERFRCCTVRSAREGNLPCAFLCESLLPCVGDPDLHRPQALCRKPRAVLLHPFVRGRLCHGVFPWFGFPAGVACNTFARRGSSQSPTCVRDLLLVDCNRSACPLRVRIRVHVLPFGSAPSVAV